MSHLLTSKVGLIDPPFLDIHVLSILALPKDTVVWTGPLITTKQSPSPNHW